MASVFILSSIDFFAVSALLVCFITSQQTFVKLFLLGDTRNSRRIRCRLSWHTNASGELAPAAINKATDGNYLCGSDCVVPSPQIPL